MLKVQNFLIEADIFNCHLESACRENGFILERSKDGLQWQILRRESCYYIFEKTIFFATIDFPEYDIIRARVFSHEMDNFKKLVGKLAKDYNIEARATRDLYRRKYTL